MVDEDDNPIMETVITDPKAESSAQVYIYEFDGSNHLDGVNGAAYSYYGVKAASPTPREEANPDNPAAPIKIYEYFNMDTEALKAHEATGSEYVDLIDPLDSTVTDLRLFNIPANSLRKITVYVWLEGQDIDCENAISGGAPINVKIGFKKGTPIAAAAS